MFGYYWGTQWYVPSVLLFLLVSTELAGNNYRIYPQPDKPAVCVYTHLTTWLNYYQTHLLGRKLEPEDYLFPVMSGGKNNTVNVYPRKNMTAQKRINAMAAEADIPGAGRFTAHCFRRGGAQYRFMYAPIGERWTLARVRWWGGWAEGEHRDTMIRYLLDELYNSEEDHSDALCHQYVSLGRVTMPLEAWAECWRS
ncbi:hypothetical protein B0H13DRAFT_1854899 [Mycena leptocephala]|nr:hypothetical protein B0H13DRAFT_1854899 [Mycena leptocephala]